MGMTSAKIQESRGHLAVPDVSLDTIGLVCPLPALRTQQALGKMQGGQVLEVITNNEPTAERSIPILCEKAGATFETFREGDRWRFLIRK